ncbi:hypothetical protein HPP92_018862 [Vanilla planifolia]|uniref:Uncharacterized protein n=1 Tax=Vanilla planifolia TaxID=51239 RepID=A0A835Q4S6_VANPL|nr:hypothetical protein HPP92_018862 [Vanilla planifolia]
MTNSKLADLASAKEIKREKPHTWMELHGKKKTRDFLSLYTEEPNFQPQHSRHGSQGVFMKTHDFLQPLETAEGEKTTKGPMERSMSAVEHVQSRETGTCIAGHVSVPTVKPEAGTCVVRSAPESKFERDSDTGAAFAFTFWDATSAAEDHWPTRGQRPSFAVSSPPSFGSLLSSRNNEFQDNKLLMDSASRFSKGFEEEDDEGDEFGKGEGSSHKEFTVKVDTKSSELKASTPRSKHSATEQRRRSKINERNAIRDMVVRGAPAIAIAAALSLAVEVFDVDFDFKGRLGMRLPSLSRS